MRKTKFQNLYQPTLQPKLYYFYGVSSYFSYTFIIFRYKIASYKTQSKLLNRGNITNYRIRVRVNQKLIFNFGKYDIDGLVPCHLLTI